MPVFDSLRYRRDDGRVFLFAFDLLQLDGEDLRREPLEVRKAALASVLAVAASRCPPDTLQAKTSRRAGRGPPAGTKAEGERYQKS